MKTIQEAWCRETSADPAGWSESNPAWGQCAVTALLVQDLLGGKLLRGTIGSVSHYWNEVGNWHIDLTYEQFHTQYEQYIVGMEYREREYVLSFPDTARRYELLKALVYD